MKIEEKALEVYPIEEFVSYQIDGVVDKNETKRKCFIEGANWMKEQMMEGAANADVGYYNQYGLSLYLEKSLEKLGFDEHDNVKIVVIKEE